MIGNGQMIFIPLEDRGVVRLSGADARDFLQGLVTNDIGKAGPGRAVWAALLTPQGKYLHDFFVIALDGESGGDSGESSGGGLLLDCERARIDDLIQRLTRYRLRAKVEISDVSDDWAAGALVGAAEDTDSLIGEEGRGAPFAGGICYVDPRFGGIGARALVPRGRLDELQAAGFTTGEPAEYDHARICAGLPDGSRDLPVDKAYLMENGFDALNGIDWKKGCYVGQELTARMRYRGTAKRRLLPVAIDGAAPEPGAEITLAGKDAGEMRSAAGDVGLALLRVEALEKLAEAGEPLRAGAATLSPLRPPWLKAEATDGA